jgi:putative protein kinase ArgK-like GTPase of G3E family
VADVVAVHKADLPGAEQLAAQVRTALDLSGDRPVPVVRVSSKTGEGIADLWQAIRDCPRRRETDSGAAELLRLAQEMLADRFAGASAAHDRRLGQLLDRWQQGELPPEEAGAALLQLLGQADAPR